MKYTHTLYLGEDHLYVRRRNGTPLQYSCLKNPRDGGAWWAAVCGVAQSQTQLKQLSTVVASLCRNRNTIVEMTHAEMFM